MAAFSSPSAESASASVTRLARVSGSSSPNRRRRPASARSARTRASGRAAEAALNLGDGVVESGLNLRLRAKIRLDAARPVREELTRGDRFSPAVGRVRSLEDADEKGLNALGAPRIDSRHARLPQGGRQSADERHEDERRRRDAGAVSAHELARAVADGVGAGLDPLTRQMPPDVLAPSPPRRRNAARARGAGFLHDRVDVAFELLREPARLARRLRLGAAAQHGPAGPFDRLVLDLRGELARPTRRFARAEESRSESRREPRRARRRPSPS